MIEVLYVITIILWTALALILYRVGYSKGYKASERDTRDIYRRSLLEIKETYNLIYQRIEELKYDNNRDSGIVQDTEK